MSFSLFGRLRRKASKAVEAFKRTIHVPVGAPEVEAPDAITALEEQINAAQMMEATSKTPGWALIEQDQLRCLNAAMTGLMEAKNMEDVRALQAECFVLRREMNRVHQACAHADVAIEELKTLKQEQKDREDEENG